MRGGWRAACLLGVLAALGGCEGDSSSSGVSLVTVSREELETVSGGGCAVRGHATNTGNVRARVRLAYEARNAAGAVIGTSTSAFEVAAFSDFEFAFGKGNQDGQPSSTPFSNGLACGGIQKFERVDTDVDQA
jgi:hypothetical protein